MPAESLCTLAVDDLAQALRSIRVAGGYATDLGILVEDELGPTERHGSGLAGAVVGIETVTSSSAAETSLETVDVIIQAWHAFRRPAQVGDASPRTLAARMARDIEKAIKIDYTRGGIASDTAVLSWAPEPDPADGAIVWLSFKARITLLRSWDDASEPLQEPTGDLA